MVPRQRPRHTLLPSTLPIHVVDDVDEPCSASHDGLGHGDRGACIVSIRMERAPAFDLSCMATGAADAA